MQPLHFAHGRIMSSISIIFFSRTESDLRLVKLNHFFYHYNILLTNFYLFPTEGYVVIDFVPSSCRVVSRSILSSFERQDYAIYRLLIVLLIVIFKVASRSTESLN